MWRLWLWLIPSIGLAQLPFELVVEPVQGASLPGLHSYAKAQHGPYWLLVGGRIDGLHSMFPTSAFSFEEQNHYFIVIDTQSWTYQLSSLHLLPPQQRFALATTNQQFFQDGNYLYVIGGYGFDSAAKIKKTFPTLCVLRVDSLIEEILNNGINTAAYVRHVTDTFFAVTGGRLEKLDSVFLLIGGQYFAGHYTKLPSSWFTQRYTNAICRFQLHDDGASIFLKNVSCTKDSLLLHRRDLNSCPWMTADGQPAVAAYGGVFRYHSDIPYQWPIYMTADSMWVDTLFEQRFSQYTCPVFCLYDSVSGKRYTVFLAGISLYDYDEQSEVAVLDTFVPFINDASVLVHHADGATEEVVIGGLFPMRGLANAEFFPNPDVPRYGHGVFRLHQITAPTLLGYAYGGIQSTAGNFGFTYASQAVWRIWLIPDALTAEASFDGASVISWGNAGWWVVNAAGGGRWQADLYDVQGRWLRRYELEGTSMISGADLPAGVYLLHFHNECRRQVMRLMKTH
ncbi:MAG: T9SS type A sorting domain-containing protein [Chitinophagales bacterium]|nr:T9SS type A sorting domain-containing protein [Chitinophagales bacterium]MDW8428106.1 T9SS type A sorting domain-containing protein [Chitinophagales bacterium]